MDKIENLSVNDITVSLSVDDSDEKSEYPNVRTFHPKINGFNTHCENIFTIVDLSMQQFKTNNSKALESQQWWLNYENYYKSIRNELQSIVAMDDSIVGNILEMCGQTIELSSNDDIADLFVNGYTDIDSFLCINTQSSQPQSASSNFSNDDLSFLSFGNSNNSSFQPTIDSNGDNTMSEATPTNSVSNAINHIYVTKDCKLYQWFNIDLPPNALKYPSTQSRDIGSIFNAQSPMLRHWDMKLSENHRFAIIYPQKLGEIADVCLLPNGNIVWLQSLYNGDNSDAYRRVFALVLCDTNVISPQLNRKNVSSQNCKVIKLVISADANARFQLLRIGDFIVIWGFSSHGAFGDIFGIYRFRKNGSKEAIAIASDIESFEQKYKNKILKVMNSNELAQYSFENGKTLDLYRDVSKLCAYNSNNGVIFAGGCLISTLSFREICAIDITDDWDSVFAEIPSVLARLSDVPVLTLPPATQNCKTAPWITDYIPYRNGSILAQWMDKMGRSEYGLWVQNRVTQEWSSKVFPYDLNAYQNSTMACYHWGERLKTTLLAITLRSQSTKQA